MRTAGALTVSPSMLFAGGVAGPGGCTWPRGMYLAPGGAPGPWGMYLVPGDAPGPRVKGVYLVPGGRTWSGTPPC